MNSITVQSLLNHFVRGDADGAAQRVGMIHRNDQKIPEGKDITRLMAYPNVFSNASFVPGCQWEHMRGLLDLLHTYYGPPRANEGEVLSQSLASSLPQAHHWARSSGVQLDESHFEAWQGSCLRHLPHINLLAECHWGLYAGSNRRTQLHASLFTLGVLRGEGSDTLLPLLDQMKAQGDEPWLDNLPQALVKWLRVAAGPSALLLPPGDAGLLNAHPTQDGVAVLMAHTTRAQVELALVQGWDGRRRAAVIDVLVAGMEGLELETAPTTALPRARARRM